jgi:hypothetical protein
MGWGPGWVAWWAWSCLRAALRRTGSGMLAGWRPAAPWVGWVLGWSLSLLFLGLGYLLFRIMKGMVYGGWPWWWLVPTALIVGVLRWAFSFASRLLRPEWPPAARRRASLPGGYMFGAAAPAAPATMSR